MDLVSADVLGVINALMPGFLAAWIFYGLTAHKRQSPFERTIQALIFTAIVQGITGGIHHGLEFIGRWYFIGKWTPNIQLAWSFGLAIALGLFIAWSANTNWFHKQFFKWGLTSRTSTLRYNRKLWTR